MTLVQTLPTYRSDQTFSEGILPRAARSRQDFFDVHACNSLTEVVSIDPVAVTQQVARRCVLGKGLDHLLSCPESGGVGRDIEMDDPPSPVTDHEPHIEKSIRNSGHHEEVHSRDCAPMIFKKRAPLRGFRSMPIR